MIRRQLASLAVVLFVGLASSCAGEDSWTNLFTKGLDAFKAPHGDWQEVTTAVLDADNPKKLVGKPGTGAFWNGAKGRTANLYTKSKFGDLEVKMEFMMAKGSNSGIKFHGHYEVQIADSFGKKEVTASDCGGIYPRAELKPKYHHIDKGTPPTKNACKAPGEWQTLHIVFHAPRFDKAGKKTANARLLKVVLNGELVHDNAELKTPTGNLWQGPEFPEGVLMLQADHGPVAFRNVQVRPLGGDKR